MTRPWPDGIPRRRVNAVVCNGSMVEVFDAICALESRKPHELVHDVMYDYLQQRQDEPGVKALIKARKRWRADYLRAVK